MFCRYLSHSALLPGATQLLCCIPFPQQEDLSLFRVSPEPLPLTALGALL